jgi:hypothetical protein
VPLGATGTVVRIEGVPVAVRLDEFVDGLEEWGNELHWESLASALEDLETVEDS